MTWNESFVASSQPHWNKLLNFALSLTHNREQAEDILQSALMKALKAYPKFCQTYFNLNVPQSAFETFSEVQPEKHFKNWLFKIIKNTYLDDWNDIKKTLLLAENLQKNHKLEEEFRLQQQNSHPTVQISTENLAKEEERFYKAALDDSWKNKLSILNARQRSILFLIADGYSYKEVAQTLDIPIGTVMSSLARTLEKLKKT